MSSSKTYTASDIERYHKGDMSAAEMHALESAALDDPFLADALEGYRHSATATADVHTLQERLKERIGEKEKKTVFFIRSSWMRIAALFLVIAGGGWLVFQTFSDKENALSSRTIAAPERQNQEMAADSTITVQLAPAVPPGDSLKRTDAVVASGTSAVKSRAAQPQTNAASPSAIASDAGIKTEETNMAAASAPAADQADRSNIAALKSNVPVTTATEAADTTLQQDVVAKTSPENRLPATTRRKTDLTGAAGNAAMAIPEGGWPAFENYVRKNRKGKEERKARSGTENSVELSFDIDGNGRPVNIVVIKSLCDNCNSEAIRLLKEGPKWRGVNAKGFVRIQF